MRNAELYAKVARRAMGTAQRYASAYGDANRNSLVRIMRGYEYSSTEGRFKRVETPTVVYDDKDFPGIGAPAGVTPTQGPAVLDFGDEPSSYDSIIVYLPLKLAVQPMIDDLVQVTFSPVSAVAQRAYRVTSVPTGGRLAASTVVHCTGLAPSKEG